MVLCATLIVWLGPTLRAQPAADDNVVALPPLMVEERTAPLRWRYFASPGMEVLSVCDDTTSEKFVRRHHRLVELLRMLLPGRFCVQLAVPEAHILFNEETGRARSREVIAEMVGKAGASVAPDGTIKLPPPRHDLRGRSEPRIRFLPNIRLVDLDAVRVFAILRDASDGPMGFTFTKERIAFLLARRAPALPDWFIDGFLEVYGQAKFHEDEIELGPIAWLTDDESAALARDPKRPRALLPMKEMFAAWRPARDGNESEVERVWRSQCALFVHWALSDPTGERREALWTFLDRLETEPRSEALFREIFGIGFSDARDRLSDYLPVAARQGVKLRAPKSGRAPRIKFRAATDLEIAVLRGDWERLQIHYVRAKYPALTDSYIEQARRTLRRAYERGERDPRLLAVLGLTECDAGNHTGAREFLEEAVRARVIRPRVYLELATLRFKELQDAGAGRKLSAEETRSVLAPLLSARLDAPPIAEIYGLIANVWLQSAEPPSPADLAVLEEGVRLFPTAAGLVMRVIHLHVIHGALGPAAGFAESGLSHARDPAVRARFERVRAELARVKP